MKKLIGFFAAILGLFLFTGSAFAATPNWYLNAPSSITFVCGGNPYYHTLDTVSEDYGTGDFAGTGFWNNNGAYTWDVDGNVSGDSITFTLVYTGANSGYTLHGVGVIAPDGSVSGTTDGNCQSFSMPVGTASTINYTLNWGTHINPSSCPDRVGKPILNVTYKVKNDIDSGFHGYWAYDNNNKQLQVWKNEDGTYCAISRYEGQFDAEGGQNSPGSITPTVLSGSEKGTFQGGYVGTITGEFNPGDNPVKGSLGVKDYNCDISTTHCDYFSWLGTYFPGAGFTYDWWGWIYHGGLHGTWINSSDGSFGNIN